VYLALLNILTEYLTIWPVIHIYKVYQTHHTSWREKVFTILLNRHLLREADRKNRQCSSDPKFPSWMWHKGYLREVQMRKVIFCLSLMPEITLNVAKFRYLDIFPLYPGSQDPILLGGSLGKYIHLYSIHICFH
jgi:hypothetical protein